MLRTIHIRTHQLGLLFRRGDLDLVLGPGTHRLPFAARLRKYAIELVDVLEPAFQHRLLDVLVGVAALRERLHVLDLADEQRALVWKDGRLHAILGPGRHAFWKQPFDLRFETFDVHADARLVHPRLDAILRHPDAARRLMDVQVEPLQEVVVFREGVPVARLREGRYACWTTGTKAQVSTVDLREQVADVAGQEIMTRDKVTLRVNLVVTSRVEDALRAVTSVGDWAQAVYREAQLALRASVGARTLDALLADKEAVGAEIQGVVARRAEAFGVRVLGVGLRDLVLPGGMKAILNQVITAQKQAEANVIKRREEIAAARSQAQTARLLAENPMLVRIKELEALQEILAGARTAFVFGGGDLATQIGSLVGGDPTPAT